MDKQPVLAVMAAGMGSRYGGLKQIDPVGSRGEAILDYSLYDAYRAGFRTAVIIIKEAIRKDFMDTVGARLANSPMEIRYAFQELDACLPEGIAVPEGRTKPWGTSHCVLCAADAIGGAPFAVINADDYYGPSAFRSVYEALCGLTPDRCCMVGYDLGNTVTDNGSVARGVCCTDEKGFLTSIVERTRIEKRDGGIAFTEDGENWEKLEADTPVSMNLWGFHPGFLQTLQADFPGNLQTVLAENPLKGEIYLPLSVSQQMARGVQVQVLRSRDKWYGVTYAADKPQVVAALREMTEAGLYPDGLWG